jgi:hypothetical protein
MDMDNQNPAPPPPETPYEPPPRPEGNMTDFPPAPPAPTPPPPLNPQTIQTPIAPVKPKKRGMFLFLIVAMVIVMSVATLGYLFVGTDLLKGLGIDLNRYYDFLPFGSSQSLSEQATAATPTPIPLPPSPNPTPTPMFSVNVPVGWIGFRHSQCQLELYYPPDWSVKPDCVVGSDQIQDCIYSQNFSGQTLSTGNQIDEGMVITIQCQPSSFSDINQLADDCRQRIALRMEDLNTCDLFVAQKYPMVVFKPGEYHTLINNQEIIFRVAPPPPTIFSLLGKIFGSISPVLSTE